MRQPAPRGRHVQVGLLPPALGQPAVPMARVIALELEIARQPRHGRPRLPADARPGRRRPLRPDLLVTRRIGLDRGRRRAAGDGRAGAVAGITVIDLVR